MTSDTSERGLEELIVRDMTEKAGGWIEGKAADYDREFCVDLAQLATFLHSTQPDVAESMDLAEDSPTRRKVLSRLQGEVTKRGTIDVLRNGIRHGPHDITLFYGTASSGNEKAQEQYASNRFSVTRQLRYSRDETQLALDLGAFINGLPIATFELKNNLTKQTVEDAVEQYRRDRDPRESLFQFGRWEKRLGSFLSTRATRTAPATRRIRMASRPIICGSRPCHLAV
jgi:type I restriction enzyme R subunit